MKILYEKPPVYDRIVKAIGTPPPGALFTYGDTIYVPSGVTPNADLVAHEEQHMRQQGSSPQDWWRWYLKDAAFRLAQETMAYTRQLEHVIETHPRDAKAERRGFARLLSSGMYGSLTTYTEAWKAIGGYA